MTISITASDLKLLNAGFPVAIQGPKPTVPPVPPPSSALAVKIAGGKLVDGAGKPLRLKGVNCAGLEFTAIQGWAPNDPWGGQTPNFAAIKAWGCNAVRLPLNEASWLGLTTYDYSGATRKADPGGNYHATLAKCVADATAAGLYVILDLHWGAPKLKVAGQSLPVPFSPMGQPPLADADYSISFWSTVATAFKALPNVIFDLFNEPYIDSYGGAAGSDAWALWRDGGTAVRFPNNSSGGANFDMVQPWKIAGMQSLLNAIRATGATNVVMAGGLSYAKDPSNWLSKCLTDPLKQLACSVHLYPAYGTTPGSAAYAQPNFAPAVWTQLAAIQAANYPVIIGETGGHNSTGTVGDALVSNVLKWADANAASVFGWCWNTWGNNDNVLIRDAAGTPTDGYGKVFQAWSNA